MNIVLIINYSIMYHCIMNKNNLLLVFYINKINLNFYIYQNVLVLNLYKSTLVYVFQMNIS